MCRSCFAKYKAMSKMRNELFEKAGEALAIYRACGHMPYIIVVLIYNVKLVQFQQIHNDQQGKEGGTLFLNSHLLNASSQRMMAHLQL